MLLVLRLGNVVDSLCKKPASSMDDLCERGEGYIWMEEMSRFRNEVQKTR